MNNKLKRVFAVITSLVLCLSLVLQVAAVTQEELEAEYDRLDGEISDLQSEINQLNKDKKNKEAAKKKIDQQIAALKSQINVLERKIDTIQANIRSTKKEIETKETEIVDSELLLRQRLKAQYMTPEANTLTTILGCTSYSEMLRQVDNMVRIAQNDNELIETLTKEKEALVEKKAKLERDKASVEASQALLADKRATLNSESTRLQGVIQDINDDKQSAQSDINTLKKEQQKLEEQIQAIIEANKSPENSYDDDTSKLLFPVNWSYRISAPYGYSSAYGSAFHTGIDVARPYGTASILGKPIRAAASGKVISVIYSNSGYGYHLLIDHGAGLYTLYAHCSSIAVKSGQYVQRGQTISYIGSTGNSTGPHLHFEVRTTSRYGSHVNPMKYF